VRRAILSLARKNGKTALTAAIALAHLIGPERIENGEIYSAANDREQASIVFRIAAQIVRADPELSEVLRVVDSTKTITNYGNGSFYRAISAEHGTKHGFNPSVVIYDELAQAKGRLLYDVLDTSMGARREPLFIVISTQSNDPEHVLSRLIDDGLNSDDPTIVCHLFAVPDDCPDIYDPTVWKKANPALNDFRDLADFKALASKAKRMPAEEPKFRNLFLNQRVSPVSSLIPQAEWMACAAPAEFVDGEAVYLGLDLSSVNDLTALLMVSADPKDDRVRAFLWKPLDTLAEHSQRDFGAGNRRYEEWNKDGHLLATPGRTIDKGMVATTVAELCSRYKVLGLAYDRWRIEDLLKEFDRIGFRAHEEGEQGDGLKIVKWGQGWQDMAPAIDALEKSVMERRLKHPSNPVLTWNIANTVARTDPSGNRKLDKNAARFRIDGAVALAMCLGLKARDRTTTPSYHIFII
jgi:phage terminase large subunit-like protein